MRLRVGIQMSVIVIVRLIWDVVSDSGVRNRKTADDGLNWYILNLRGIIKTGGKGRHK